MCFIISDMNSKRNRTKIIILHPSQGLGINNKMMRWAKGDK